MAASELGHLNPYVGPRSFTEREQGYFFGRDEEARQLAGLVIAHRAVLLYAQSGAGKTSLLRAKVIPALRDDAGVTVLTIRRVSGDLPPGTQASQVPNIYVAGALLNLEGLPAPRGPQPEAAGALATSFGDVLRPYLTSGDGGPVLLILDQFEELFTSHPEQYDARAGFFRELAECLSEHAGLSLLISMREDYIAELDAYVAQLPDRLRTRYRLERLGYDGALAAVRGPAKAAGRAYARGVAEGLVDNLRRIQPGRRVTRSSQPTPAAAGPVPTPQPAPAVPGASAPVALGPYVEPVHLQIVCRQLWESLPAERETIEAGDVQEFGDVDDALAGFYRAALARAVAETGARERSLRTWFSEQLITPANTRGLVYQGERETEGLPNAAVDVLNNAYVIRAVVRGGDTWYELAHDRLVGPVQSDNAAWFREHLSTLQRQAELWERQGRSKDLLLRGDALLEAERWAGAHEDELLDQEREFLEACREARAVAERERRQAGRIRWLAIGASLLAVLALISGSMAVVRSGEAVRSRNTAEAASTQAVSALNQLQTSLVAQETAEAKALQATVEAGQAKAAAEADRRLAEAQGQIARSRQVAAASYVALDRGDGELAILLAASALQITDTVEAQEALHHALTTWRGRGVLGPQEDRVSSAAFSPDGRIVATAAQKVVHLWEVEGGRRTLALAHDGAVTDMKFSPDGRYLATTSREDGAGRLWEVETGRLVWQVPVPRQGISVAFRPDGQVVAFGGDDGAIALRQVPSGEPAGRLVHDSWGFPIQLKYSPDGALLAGAYNDDVARIWSGDRATVLRGHHGIVFDIVFSPDGSRVATSGQDDTIRLWDPRSGDQLAMTGDVRQLGWRLQISPDGRYLAAPSQTGVAYLWDTSRPDQPPAILPGHTQAASAVAFSPDGRLLATASDDHTARLWDIAARAAQATLLGHTDRVVWVTFSPDGRFLATTSDDRTARLWDPNVDTGGEVALVRTGKPVLLAGLAPDGRAVAVSDGRLHLWRPGYSPEPASGTPATAVEGSSELISLPIAAADVRAAALSPDGRRVAVADGQGQVLLLAADTGQTVSTIPARDGTLVHALAFHPRQPILALAGADGEIRVRQLETGEEQSVSGPRRSDVYAVAFSPDGALLVSGHGNGDVIRRQWPAGSSGRLPGSGRLPERAVAFTPDGARLLAADDAGTIRIWDPLATGDVQDVRTDILHTVNPVRVLAFSADGGLLASGDEGGTVRAWDWRAGVGFDLTGHRRWITGLAFTADGQGLVSAGQDGTVRLWPVTPEATTKLACARVSDLEQYDWRQRVGEVPPWPVCSGERAIPWTPALGLPPPGPPIPPGSLLPAPSLPVIYYFEVLGDSSVIPGATITLRWDLEGASRGAYLYVDGQEQGVAAPDQKSFTVERTTVYRLVARNEQGETARELKISAGE